MLNIRVEKTVVSRSDSPKESDAVSQYLNSVKDSINFTECLSYLGQWDFNTCDLNSYELKVHEPFFNKKKGGGVTLLSC